MRRRRLTSKKPAHRPGPTRAEAERVLALLEEIDAARADLNWYYDDIWALRSQSARVRRAWAAFMDAGGVTAEDWVLFCRGEPLRGCARQKKHLRVVSDRPAGAGAGRPRARNADGLA